MKMVRKSKRKNQSSKKVRRSLGMAMWSVLRSSQNQSSYLMLMTMPLWCRESSPPCQRLMQLVPTIMKQIWREGLQPIERQITPKLLSPLSSYSLSSKECNYTRSWSAPAHKLNKCSNLLRYTLSALKSHSTTWLMTRKPKRSTLTNKRLSMTRELKKNWKLLIVKRSLKGRSAVKRRLTPNRDSSK